MPQIEWREEILKYPQPELHELIRSHIKDFMFKAKIKRK